MTESEVMCNCDVYNRLRSIFALGKDWHVMRVEVFLQSAALKILQQKLSSVSFPAGR